MDAAQGFALVSASALTGTSYRLPGPGGFSIVVSSVDAQTLSAGNGALIDDRLVGLRYRIDYGARICDCYA